jgi:DHA2 family methylenomycin A resistance protein-like MFS transporter
MFQPDHCSMRKHLTLAVICSGYFVVILDAVIVNVALPSLGHELQGAVSDLQWVVDGYTVAFAGLLLSAGALGDRLGAKRVFAAGLAVFTFASAACAASPSVAALICARVVQGAGAAMLVPSSLALIRGAYEEARERARAVGIWGATAGIGAASGPILGGLLVAAFGWRSVFVVNLPVGLAALLIGIRWIGQPSSASLGIRFDPLGQLTGFASLTLLASGLIEGGAHGWISTAALALLSVALVCGVLFVAIEKRVRGPMLPLGLFRNREFSAAAFIGLAINLGFYGQLFALTLYFQHVRGYSALQTGLALLPEGLFVALSSALSGRLTARTGPRLPMLVGLATGACGLAGLMVAGKATPYATLIAPLIAAGFGMAFTMPAATVAIIEAAPAERTGIASGVLNAARQTGSAIGVALLGALLAGQVVTGLHTAMGAAAASFLAAAAVAASILRRSRIVPGVETARVQ